MVLRSIIALLAGAAIGAFAAQNGMSGSEVCTSDACAADEAGELSVDEASQLQLLAGHRNLSVIQDTHADGGAHLHVKTRLTETLTKALHDGLLVRAPDIGVQSPSKPATFWRADIYAPNQLYLWDEAMTLPKTGFKVQKGFHYLTPKIAYVVLAKGNQLFHTKTLYPHDANACDSPSTPKNPANTGRCHYVKPKKGKSFWDCPHAFGRTSKRIKYSASKMGSGWYKCQGCHFLQGKQSKTNPKKYWPGQINTVPTSKIYDQASGNCKCACKTKNGCRALATELVRDKWLKDSAWGSDSNICWTDSTDNLAAMQNSLWDAWQKYNPGKAHLSVYWGWNEVAVDKAIDSPKHWEAVVIYLPPAVSNSKKGCGLECLSASNKKVLDEYIDEWGKENGLHTMQNLVIARQNEQKGKKYTFEFFCQSFTTGKYQICAQEKTNAHSGYCKIAKAGAHNCR